MIPLLGADMTCKEEEFDSFLHCFSSFAHYFRDSFFYLFFIFPLFLFLPVFVNLPVPSSFIRLSAFSFVTSFLYFLSAFRVVVPLFAFFKSGHTFSCSDNRWKYKCAVGTSICEYDSLHLPFLVKCG